MKIATAARAQLVSDLQLASHTPSTPTGATLRLVWPDGPDGKPKPETEGVFELPEGTVVDEAAIPSYPPGYPPGTSTTAKQSDQVIDLRATDAGAFITTPPTCPAGGEWISHTTITYTDGTVDRATGVMPYHA